MTEKIEPASGVDTDYLRCKLASMWPELDKFSNRWKYEQTINVPEGPQWAIGIIRELGELLAASVDAVDALRAEVERLEGDARIAEVGASFHKLAIAQRDHAWVESARHKAERDEARAKLAETILAARQKEKNDEGAMR